MFNKFGFLIFFFSGFIFTSCTKSKVTRVSSATPMIGVFNNEEVKFSNATARLESNDLGSGVVAHTLIISGFNFSMSAIEKMLVISISQLSEIRTGTYENGSTDVLGFEYRSNSSVTFPPYGIPENVTSAMPYTNPIKVEITAITSTEVRGKFSGDAYEDNDITKQRMTVRDGEFIVRIE